MKIKKTLGTIGIAIIGGLIALLLYTLLNDKPQKVIVTESKPSVRYANLPADYDSNSIDFIYAAEASIHAVVHVKTKSLGGNYSANPLYEFFFGDPYNYQQRPVVGFGSGVIVSKDGYIVTNNHVIERANEIEVALNDGRTFAAEVSGTDPQTDLALLKIEEEGLPYINMGSSDELKVGEWVLAVGNPYNLTSTVTAGIVSAKARDWPILERNYAINSFIQTDAAVNPGNSGGALVNIKGELVGINTAIASQTGSYAGYSFAIPVEIVKKVVSDLKKYGAVQRAILGVEIRQVDSELAEEEGLDKIEGVYISGVFENGAAKEAGIKAGDVILKIDDTEVNKTSELQEKISRYRPGDEVEILIKRKGQEKIIEASLKNMQGTTEIVKRKAVDDILGAEFRDISDNEKRRLGIKYGVKVEKLLDGKLKNAGVKEGFIITEIDNKAIKSIDELNSIIESAEGGVLLEGIYPEDGVIAYYAFGV